MATLDSVVWNCGGLTNTSSSHKAMFFEKKFGATFDIAVLLETHHKDKAALPQELLRYEKSYEIVHSPAPQKPTQESLQKNRPHTREMPQYQA